MKNIYLLCSFSASKMFKRTTNELNPQKEKNYANLPNRILLLSFLLMSTAFIFGQNMNQAKASLQSLEVRTSLVEKKGSKTVGEHRKDVTSKSDYSKTLTSSPIPLKKESPVINQEKIVAAKTYGTDDSQVPSKKKAEATREKLPVESKISEKENAAQK